MTKPAAENSTKKQRGRPFQKGQSGNPKGKPKGVRNRLTLAAEALLDGEGDMITRKTIELAKDGDMTAIRLCLERKAANLRATFWLAMRLPDARNATSKAQTYHGRKSIETSAA